MHGLLEPRRHMRRWTVRSLAARGNHQSVVARGSWRAERNCGRHWRPTEAEDKRDLVEGPGDCHPDRGAEDERRREPPAPARVGASSGALHRGRGSLARPVSRRLAANAALMISSEPSVLASTAVCKTRADMSAELAPAPRARFWIAPGQHAPERSRSPAAGCHRDRIPPPAARAHQLPPPCSSCTPWTPCAFVARGETRKKPSGRDGRNIQGWDRGRCQEGYRRFYQHMPSRVRYVTLTMSPSQLFRMSPAQATKSTNSVILPGQQSREPRLVSRTQSRRLLATKSTNVI